MPIFDAIASPCKQTALGLSAFVALSGCLASNSPTITPASAEDVGEVLEYWSRLGDNPKNDRFRFVRPSGSEYQLYVVNRENPEDMTGPLADGVLIRRFGKREADDVFLIQFDLDRIGTDGDGRGLGLGFQFVSYLLAIDSQGVGSVGTYACNDKEVSKRNESLGLAEVCTELGDLTVPFITSEFTEASIWSFLSDLQNAGLINWEDQTGVGVLDNAF